MYCHFPKSCTAVNQYLDRSFYFRWNLQENSRLHSLNLKPESGKLDKNSRPDRNKQPHKPAMILQEPWPCAKNDSLILPGHTFTRIKPWFLFQVFVPLLATAFMSQVMPREVFGQQVHDRIAVHHIEPDSRGGQAYRLVYLVGVPVPVYWKFKTDFNNDFLESNKYIKKHRFISRCGNTVITEDEYTHNPETPFRWKTTIFPQRLSLEFILTNPEECGQKFHYGHIDIESVRHGTRVTQEAYFDFWGASFWALFPWSGGMEDFLTYTAHWEQRIVLKLKDRYD